MMKVWQRQALEVDLGSGQISVLPLSDTLLHATLGGRGLAGHLFRQYGLDSSQPVVCLATGPFAGQQIETAERMIAVFRSPLSGGVFVASASSSFAVAFKSAGYDALIIKGRAPKIAHLLIDSARGRVTTVPQLVGLDTHQTLEQLAIDAALVIGPAGEHCVKYAAVIAGEGEPFARGGLGAIFGLMNLKAVSAVGAHKPKGAHAPAYLSAKADIQRLFNASPYLLGPLGIANCGSAALLDLTQARQMLPTSNFSVRSFERAAEFCAAQLKKQPGYRAKSCPGCGIGCRKVAAAGILPEYDSLAHFSALAGATDLSECLDAERACQRWGLDPVSTAVFIAAIRDTSPVCQRIPLPQIIRQMALQVDADGAPVAIDAPIASLAISQCSVCARNRNPHTVKGIELPALDPRGAYGVALSLALSCCGDYQQAQAHFHELLRKPVPTERLSFSGKARIIAQAEEATAACDSLAVCRHTLIAAGLEEYAALLTAISGIPFDAADLAASGRQTLLRERWLNQQFGFSVADDVLPARFYREAGDSVSNELAPINETEFIAERQRYYRLRGLNEQGQLDMAPPEPR